MAVLKLYNDEKVIELLNDESDMENPLDSWSFDGNNGLSTDRTLFLLVTEHDRTFWRSIHIRYNMMNDRFYINNLSHRFYINNLSHEEYFEIDLNDDDEISKYFMVDTEDIVDFEKVIGSCK